MKDIPTWQEYFMGFAQQASTKSKDPTTKVGCVVVGPDGEIRASGFNGIPRGVADTPGRLVRPAKYLWTSHAEENAVAHSARVGVSLKGCKLYVTHHPCSRCARLLIQAGVSSVVVGPGSTSMPNEEFTTATIMFQEAKVSVLVLFGTQDSASIAPDVPVETAFRLSDELEGVQGNAADALYFVSRRLEAAEKFLQAMFQGARPEQLDPGKWTESERLAYREWHERKYPETGGN